jgi:hypothetical protein
MSDGDIAVAAAKLEEQRLIAPPIQPVVKAGSIVIRDIRLWHAGMPNRTLVPRPMIAMIHTVAWMPGGKPKFRRDAEPILRHPVLRHQVEYVDEVDHIAAPMGFASSGI